MNSDFIQDNAQSFAQKVLSLGESTEGRIKSAFQIALARLPDASEVSDFRDYLESYQSKLDESPEE